MNPFNMDPLALGMRLAALIIAFTVHELSHGLMAYMLGDKTAKNDGRLTLNPIRHIDPMGLVFLMIFSFGWAKPVMVDPRNFQYPKQDMALTAVAGPLSNFIMAFVTTMIFYPLVMSAGSVAALGALGVFLQFMIIINLALGIFNLLPIPPLDGSKLFGVILPDRTYFTFISMGSRYGMILLLILIATNQLVPIISMLHSFAFNLLIDIARFIYT
ncbi:MAG: site-2 protease family protein [Defluviitaleaceae bacterium]|nr:site-2 protease family protein [Defluviitaleaceae bacterium]